MRYNNGFTLLISVLIVSIMLAISLGISNIITGEIFLSNTGRQSQVAFYAADAGMECAIYWDTVHQGLGQSAFATSTPTSPIKCTGSDIPVIFTSPAGFYFELFFSNGSCAKVSVTKRDDYSDPSAPTIETFIHSDGQNTCADTPRVFQRSLETTIRE